MAAETGPESNQVKVKITFSIDALAELALVKRNLQAQDIITAAVAAARIISTLYSYQRQGFHFELWKPGDTRPFRLPEN